MAIDLHAPSRRELLLSSGVLFAWNCLPKAARAEGRDPRLLVMILRGALDGLAAVAPVGDPEWTRLRGDKALGLASGAQGAPPAPKGFDDQNAAWLDGLAQRLDIANQFGRRVTQPLDPKDLVETALGPLASPETRQTVARAESRPQAIALLLMSAEFQRR